MVGGWVLKPILVFSFDQAEQLKNKLINIHILSSFSLLECSSLKYVYFEYVQTDIMILRDIIDETWKQRWFTRDCAEVQRLCYTEHFL